MLEDINALLVNQWVVINSFHVFRLRLRSVSIPRINFSPLIRYVELTGKKKLMNHDQCLGSMY